MNGTGFFVIVLGLAALIAGVILSLLRMAELRRELEGLRNDSGERQRQEMAEFENAVWRALKESAELQNQSLRDLNTRFQQFSGGVEQRLDNLRNGVGGQLEGMNKNMNWQIANLTRENSRQLDQIRETVDEKLQKTLEQRIGQSFRTVNESLEQVSRGLGEMQNLARGVGDLKKVLSNVKTRGNLGEIQLGAILEEILAPDQYDTNVNTTGSGREVVEFAVKMPGENGNRVWLPIDSKFPGDSYAALLDAYDRADPRAVEAARKNLAQVVKKEAKDIREKYIAPPNTTDFGVMFLPSEGLYAEVIRMGLLETLQREYRVNVAGPATMAALLNSLQMGFRTLAIGRRTSEVWNTLSAVKTEFGKFEEVLRKAQDNLAKTSTNLDQLIGVRTRVMQQKLKDLTMPEDR
ncbi:DNA recombination protein RmuC [Eubacterium pyruvativorans]|uniref:DNA recombination protein RmuC n=1 Tax=Eubacterium pyruvativorans TaxID=155865 RepID=UPI0013D4D16E|nr:DNA recombination protein RmuC [Eubacterium pyruvativorans]MCI5747652.1 DNA recombination protein RmuC [Eubacterium pyruvativorans]MDD6708428.1 DNA recombination protein RmuC [Eubacterium pyruvativorans]MDD7684622.1 DNA recombination protein RmuC [Eubacterium pyruvativorans]MDY4049788.1 DNA recombination protein RmuC [Eubacterium pyruvativorans]